ncbi:unnamed protein product [Periconia digitata]|uniref:Uncharacterized protein n=1 Tax=Periconia digitata TaxID=1303443 RepID=A0A9W4U8W9_9PLEO|nr:unnamed protein product [Periconia digitata]
MKNPPPSPHPSYLPSPSTVLALKQRKMEKQTLIPLQTNPSPTRYEPRSASHHVIGANYASGRFDSAMRRAPSLFFHAWNCCVWWFADYLFCVFPLPIPFSDMSPVPRSQSVKESGRSGVLVDFAVGPFLAVGLGECWEDMMLRGD